MTLRSLLFVPGDNEKMLHKSLSSEADAIIVDLEDAVAHPRKSFARDLTKIFLKDSAHNQGAPDIFVRVNAFGSHEFELDLTILAAGLIGAIVLPKCSGPNEVSLVSDMLMAIEGKNGLPDQKIGIVALAGETAAGVLSLASYPAHHSLLSRLIGLGWGPWDLSADLGASRHETADGTYTLPMQFAMASTLIAAKAIGVQAIDTVFTEFRNDQKLARICECARQDGWTGKMAIHPAQVPIINEIFLPTELELGYAKKVISAFATSKGGVVSLDGNMLDLPHLKQAQTTVERAAFRRNQTKATLGPKK